MTAAHGGIDRNRVGGCLLGLGAANGAQRLPAEALVKLPA
jgi:hypothetical protein